MEAGEIAGLHGCLASILPELPCISVVRVELAEGRIEFILEF